MTIPLHEHATGATIPAAVTNGAAAARMSTRYGMIDTAQVIAAFAENNYLTVQSSAKKTKKQDPREVKHMVRLRHTDHALSINGAVPEIVMLNAHDGTSSLRLLSGLFRLVCSNGLVVQSHALVEEVRIRHTHKALDEALTAARTVMAASIEAAHQIHRWEQVMLTNGEQVRFAAEASSLWTGRIPAQDLLAVRRPDDAGDDLWRVFNRVQENLTAGGIVGRTATGRQTRTRGIRAVDSSVRVNGALWALAERFSA